MIKRIFSLFFAVVFSMLCMHSVAAEEQTTVHYVNNEYDLILMHDFPDHSFYLTEDIYLSQDWAVCGATEAEAFSGLLDGQGHKVTYVNVASDSDTVAFIGYLKGTVKSVNFVRVEVNARDGAVVGGIAAYNMGTITDCSISGKIIHGSKTVDKCGIAAVNKGVISNCRDNTAVADNSVSSTSQSGSAITNSTPSANISSHVSNSTTSTNSIITQIDYNNSSNSLANSSVNSSADEDRENAVEYFERTEYDDGKKVNKNVTIAVICIAAAGMLAICGISIYREIKITRLEKQNKKK